MKGTLLVKPKSAQLVYNTEMTGTMVKTYTQELFS